MSLVCPRCQASIDPSPEVRGQVLCPECGSSVELAAGPPRPSARLLMKDGEKTRGEFPISERIAIGKDKSCFVQILHPSVALQHAEIIPRGRDFVIRDLGSTPGGPGTRVNGQPVTEVGLRDGDEILVGEVRFVFIAPHATASAGPEYAISFTDTDASLDIQAALSPTELATPLAHELKQDKTQMISLELQRLTRIYEIGRELASSTDLGVVMERIMDAVQGNFRPSRAVLFLKHPASGELYTAVARSRRSKTGKSKLSVSRTIVNAAVKRREAVLIADTTQLQVGDEHTIRKQGIRSALCTPLLCKGMHLGVLYLDSLDWTRCFDESDLRMLVGIAGMAAVALMNARLIEKLQEETQLRMHLQKKLGDEAGATAATPRPTEVVEMTVVAMRLHSVEELFGPAPRPDRIVPMLTDLLGILADRIATNHGALSSVVGSQILAFWSAGPGRDPVTLALKTAFELQKGFTQLNAARSKRNLPPIWLGFGVAAGPAVTGALGIRSRSEEALFGGAVDLATLLAYRAGPNEVVLAGRIFERTKDHLEARPLAAGAAGLPAGAEPAYQVMGIRGTWSGGGSA